MASRRDKKVIAVNPVTEEILKAVEASGYFDDRMHIAKLAMALAIRKNLTPKRSPGRETRWGVGGFDPDGAAAAALRVLFPSEENPYRLAEDLVEAGAAYIGKMLEANPDFDLLDLLEELDE